MKSDWRPWGISALFMHSDYSPAICPSLFAPLFLESWVSWGAYGISYPTIGSRSHCNAYQILKYPSAQEPKRKIFQPFGMRSQLQELSKLCRRAWEEKERLRSHIGSHVSSESWKSLFGNVHPTWPLRLGECPFLIPHNCDPEPGVWGMEKTAAYTMRSQRFQPVLLPVCHCAWGSTHRYHSLEMKQCVLKRPLLLRNVREWHIYPLQISLNLGYYECRLKKYFKFP